MLQAHLPYLFFFEFSVFFKHLIFNVITIISVQRHYSNLLMKQQIAPLTMNEKNNKRKGESCSFGWGWNLTLKNK